MTSKNILIIFSRYPRSGRAKTRLIPLLGADGAADLQRNLTEATVAKARRLEESMAVRIRLFYTGASGAEMRLWLGDLDFHPQVEGDLGRRMAAALDASLEDGARVVLVGTDCPGLTPEVLEGAFRGLRDNDLVLGPARDGGYYLLGLRRPASFLFEDIPWGGSQVLEVTKSRAQERGLSFFCLEVLEDVDRPEDIDRLGLHGSG